MDPKLKNALLSCKDVSDRLTLEYSGFLNTDDYRELYLHVVVWAFIHMPEMYEKYKKHIGDRRAYIIHNEEISDREYKEPIKPREYYLMEYLSNNIEYYSYSTFVERSDIRKMFIHMLETENDDSEYIIRNDYVYTKEELYEGNPNIGEYKYNNRYNFTCKLDLVNYLMKLVVYNE